MEFLPFIHPVRCFGQLDALLDQHRTDEYTHNAGMCGDVDRPKYEPEIAMLNCESPSTCGKHVSVPRWGLRDDGVVKPSRGGLLQIQQHPGDG